MTLAKYVPTALVTTDDGRTRRGTWPCLVTACPGVESERSPGLLAVEHDERAHAGERWTDGCICGHGMHPEECRWCATLGEHCPRGKRAR